MGNAKCKLAVNLDSSEFVLGAPITGSVQLHVLRRINASVLSLDVCCREVIAWGDEEERRSREDKHFTMRVLSIRLMRVLNPGDYVYPFTFELPDHLPSSFEVTNLNGLDGSLHNLNAMIEFHAEARLLSPDCLIPKAKRVFRVYEPIAVLAGPPVDRHHRDSRCDVAACVTRRLHTPQDHVEVRLRVHNRTRALAIDVVISVVMVVCVKKAPGEEDTVSRSISKHIVDTILPEDAVEKEVRVSLIDQELEQQFTTSGILCKCAFFVEVVCIFEGGGGRAQLQLPISVVPSCVVPSAPPIDLEHVMDEDVNIPIAVLESELQYATPVR